MKKKNKNIDIYKWPRSRTEQKDKRKYIEKINNKKKHN